MLGVQNDEIEAGQSEKLSDARRRPGQEAAEEGLAGEDPPLEGRRGKALRFAQDVTLLLVTSGSSAG